MDGICTEAGMAQRMCSGGCVLIGLVVALAPSAPAADRLDVVHILRDWEVASSRGDQTTAQPDWSRYANTHSVHDLEAARALCGHVSARALIQQYDWTA